MPARNKYFMNDIRKPSHFHRIFTAGPSPPNRYAIMAGNGRHIQIHSGPGVGLEPPPGGKNTSVFEVVKSQESQIQGFFDFINPRLPERLWKYGFQRSLRRMRRGDKTQDFPSGETARWSGSSKGLRIV
ncbi:MAG: hypothetical protein R2875_07770 [Desulfobacterales bacterium]